MEWFSFPTNQAQNWLPTPHQLIQRYSPSAKAKKFIFESRKTLSNILDGSDPRILIIVGPCSIHDLEAAREYASYFKELALQVADTCFLVMRTYFEKPRTLMGWKGFLYDPYLDDSFEIGTGIRLARQFLRELADKEIPTASELLEIVTVPYLADLLTWGCIGARTSASGPHRQMTSSLPFPVGFKNSVDGNTHQAINGVISARATHTYIGVDEHGNLKKMCTSGNPYCHVVLRGSEERSNYDFHTISRTFESLSRSGNPKKLLIDCSHDNCRKEYTKQISVFQQVLEHLLQDSRSIAGMMLESHLYPGNQPLARPSLLKYGVSITDPCLDWSSTEILIKEAHAAFQHSVYLSV